MAITKIPQAVKMERMVVIVTKKYYDDDTQSINRQTVGDDLEKHEVLFCLGDAEYRIKQGKS